MPGLIRGVARTAAIAGTATAVSNRVSRRQANRWASQEAPPPEEQQEAPPQQDAPPPEQQAPDRITQLKELGQLHADGVLTDEEFAREKTKILG